MSISTLGEIIDDYEPHREGIYKMFTDYFRNPTMTKVKDEGEYSMYISKLYCLLNRECRYIITFVNKNSASPGTLEELKTMNWEALQTRTMTDQFKDVMVHGYQPVAEGPLLSKIHRIEITNEVSTYECEDLPIVVTLLHTAKNTPETYQNTGTVISALETYQTVVTFRK